MRTKNNEIKNYINDVIASNQGNWVYRKGENYGIRLQIEVGNFYCARADEYDIYKVEINTNPNDERADVVVEYNNGIEEGIEVKSCKNGALNGVTICNAPPFIER